MNKLHNNNKVYIYIHNCYRTSNITNDKEEAVQLIYLSIDTMSRQQYCTSVVLLISEIISCKIHCMIFQKQVM